MARRDERIKMARPGEPEAVRTTIVGGRPPGGGANVGDIPRGVEVLVKKAAVDPAFKKMLLEKRAGAAEAIALGLEPAEAAMLEAVPEAQLEAIVAHTRVAPKFRPAFLGYAAGAMLAALAAKAPAHGADDIVYKTYGIGPEIPPETDATNTNEETLVGFSDYAGVVTGFVLDSDGEPIEGALVIIKGANRFATTGDDGSFVIYDVPPGVYTLSASRIGYGEKNIENAEIKAKTITRLQFKLNQATKGTTYITGIMPDMPPDKEGE